LPGRGWWNKPALLDLEAIDYSIKVLVDFVVGCRGCGESDIVYRTSFLKRHQPESHILISTLPVTDGLIGFYPSHSKGVS